MVEVLAVNVLAHSRPTPTGVAVVPATVSMPALRMTVPLLLGVFALRVPTRCDHLRLSRIVARAHLGVTIVHPIVWVLTQIVDGISTGPPKCATEQKLHHLQGRH